MRAAGAEFRERVAHAREDRAEARELAATQTPLVGAWTRFLAQEDFRAERSEAGFARGWARDVARKRERLAVRGTWLVVAEVDLDLSVPVA